MYSGIISVKVYKAVTRVIYNLSDKHIVLHEIIDIIYTGNGKSILKTTIYKTLHRRSSFKIKAYNVLYINTYILTRVNYNFYYIWYICSDLCFDIYLHYLVAKVNYDRQGWRKSGYGTLQSATQVSRNATKGATVLYRHIYTYVSHNGNKLNGLNLNTLLVRIKFNIRSE